MAKSEPTYLSKENKKRFDQRLIYNFGGRKNQRKSSFFESKTFDKGLLNSHGWIFAKKALGEPLIGREKAI